MQYRTIGSTAKHNVRAMMQAPKLEPRGAAEWIGTIVGFMLAIPIVLGIIALLTLPFALPFAFMAVLLDEPLWWSLVLGLLVVLGCAVGCGRSTRS
jgi:hypothetical protein